MDSHTHTHTHTHTHMYTRLISHPSHSLKSDESWVNSLGRSPRSYNSGFKFLPSCDCINFPTKSSLGWWANFRGQSWKQYTWLLSPTRCLRLRHDQPGKWGFLCAWKENTYKITASWPRVFHMGFMGCQKISWLHGKWIPSYPLPEILHILQICM